MSFHVWIDKEAMHRAKEDYLQRKEIIYKITDEQYLGYGCSKEASKICGKRSKKF